MSDRSFFCTQRNTAVSSVPAGLVRVSSGCSESVRESVHMGNPVVQYDGDQLDLVARDGGPSLVHEGALHVSAAATDGDGMLIAVRQSKTNQEADAADVRYLKNGSAKAIRALRTDRPDALPTDR